MDNGQNYQTRFMIIGAIIGAITGMGAGYLIAQNSQANESDSALTTGDGLRLGVMLFGFLRQLSQLGR